MLVIDIPVSNIANPSWCLVTRVQSSSGSQQTITLFVKPTYREILGASRRKEVHEGVCAEILRVELRDEVVVEELFAVGLGKEVSCHATVTPQDEVS